MKKTPAVQFDLPMAIATDIPDEVAKAITLATTGRADEEAVAFLRRDIERHREQYRAATEKYHEDVARARQLKTDPKLVKKPRDPARAIYYLEDAISAIERGLHTRKAGIGL